MLVHRRSHRQAGDTIVEVLISIAVVSLVLTLSYATANHSAQTLQDTQEHAQALKLVQAQTELLRAYGDPGKTCIDSQGKGTDICTFNTGGNQDTNGRYQVSITNDPPCSPDTFKVSAQWDNLFGSTDTVDICYSPESGR